jgi:SPP1 family predicted phage head-tail adaptor
LDTDPYDYARVTNRLGTEVVESDQVVHIRQSIFNIGYRNDITTKMRISHNSKVYDIISIAEQKDTRNSSLDIVGELNENFTWAET